MMPSERLPAAAAMVRALRAGPERVMSVPIDGVHGSVGRHWHAFIGQGLIRQLWKLLILSITGPMWTCELKNTLLRLIGVRIGRNVFISATVALDRHFPELITIEDGAILGMYTRVFTHEVTHTHIRLGAVHIGRNALIGTGATLRSGVTVGENAVVGMQSFVTDDVAPQTLTTGEKAHMVKKLEGIV